MKCVKKIAVTVVLFSVFMALSCRETGKDPKPKIIATPKPDASLFDPFLRDGIRRYTVGVIQSGEYYNYVQVFLSILEGFKTLGWMKEVPEYADGLEMKALLKTLARGNFSEYLKFDENYIFDFNWDEANVNDARFRKLVTSDTVDIFISLGTNASRAVSKQEYIRIPVLADGITDPVGAGIIPSYNDSGKDFLTVRCDPGIYKRQLRLFHDLVWFKKIGVLYTDTEAGRSYAALADVESVARERSFDVVQFTKYLSENEDSQEAKEGYLKALREIAPSIDALYLTTQAGLTISNMPAIMGILNEFKIPSFVMMDSSIFVKLGILFGVSDDELVAAGLFDAKKIIEIFKGIKPRILNQVFFHEPKIAINVETAKTVGFEITPDIRDKAGALYP